MRGAEPLTGGQKAEQVELVEAVVQARHPQAKLTSGSSRFDVSRGRRARSVGAGTATCQGPEGNSKGLVKLGAVIPKSR